MNRDKHLYILSLKSLPYLKKHARKKFQEWVRKRDENEPCISCGKPYADKWDGGHYYKAELYSTLIFNEVNCNKQCVACNFSDDANKANYKEGLIKKYGQDAFDELEHLAKMDKLVKFKPDKLYYIEKFLYYKDKLKEVT